MAGRRWKQRVAWATAVVLLATGPAAAQEPAEEEPLAETWTFGVYFENDLFADTDEEYTNGIKLSWVSPEVSEWASMDELPAWTRPYVARLPFIHRKGPDQQRNLVLSLGQDIYTPENTEARELITTDRPYAGWLYLGVAFQNRNLTRMDDLELQLGMVGPLSFAEEAQALVHGLRGLKTPQGWSHQLNNEPAFALVYHRMERLAPPPLWRHLGYDAVFSVGGAAGTVYTYADAGLMLRAGWRLPGDFGSTLIRPGSNTNAPIGPGQTPRKRGLGVHLFVAAQGRAVLRDIFLDGNTFTSSHRVDKKTYVADLAAGIGVVWGPAKLSFAKVLRTREFEGQPRAHRFGSITLSVTY